MAEANGKGYCFEQRYSLFKAISFAVGWLKPMEKDTASNSVTAYSEQYPLPLVLTNGQAEKNNLIATNAISTLYQGYIKAMGRI